MDNHTRALTLAVAAAIGLWSAMPASAQQTAVPPAQAQAAAPAAKVKDTAPTPKSLAAWRGKVLAHLNSRRRDFGAANGVSTIAFSIDRNGKVLSTRVLRGSGNAALDKEALALAQRASPVPAPPADVVGETLHLTVPIRFKR